MIPVELRVLEEMAKLAKRYGLRSVTFGGLTVEMFPPAPPPGKPQSAADIAKALEAGEKDLTCKCGHHVDLHNDNGCLEGCPTEKCDYSAEEGR